MNPKENGKSQFEVSLVQGVNRLIRFPRTTLAKGSVSLLSIAIGVGIAILPLGSQAESFDIKTGAWEVTTTTTIEGMLIPKEVLAKMPPEQRAKFEQQMKSRAAKPDTDTEHSCITKEELDRNEILKSENPQCTRNVISNSGRKLEVEETCPPPQATKTHFKLEAKSPENYVGTIDVVQRDGGKVHVDMTGRWLSAVCKKGIDD